MPLFLLQRWRQLGEIHQIPGAGQVLRIMSVVWQTHTQLIAVLVLIFILVTSVVDGDPLLLVSRLTTMDVSVYKKSIPDAGGSQPFIRESSGGDTPAPSQKNRMLMQGESMNDKEYMLRQHRVKCSPL